MRHPTKRAERYVKPPPVQRLPVINPIIAAIIAQIDSGAAYKRPAGAGCNPGGRGK